LEFLCYIGKAIHGREFLGSRLLDSADGGKDDLSCFAAVAEINPVSGNVGIVAVFGQAVQYFCNPETIM